VLDRNREGPVHVAIDLRRTVIAPPGVIVHRMSSLGDRVRWNASPPTVRPEHAALDVAGEQPDIAAMFRVFADAVQSRRTTAVRLREAVDSRPRVARRRLVIDLLSDLADGACSVQERPDLVDRGAP
jgi:hypothetical protein